VDDAAVEITPPVVRAKVRLAEWSRALWSSGRYIANESDRWFLKLLSGANRSALKTQAGVSVFGRRLLSAPLEARRRSAIAGRKERLRKLLEAEAERARLDASPDKLVRFADQMSTLIELVLSGRVAIDAVTFEEDTSDSRPEDDRPESEDRAQ
jgi:hypothetical protein